ncbi:radical SAM family heme chaperone HemW [Chromatium okenii]|uniref:radical SAM family heme chaperone HemW n=1 Tax=Chromatium okenii TaxID=61644 RepID=UPI0026F0C95D|nr:radical SAM family heme chaperone HemW [Chromatium okenii]MBV5308583.1 radical SAM family heme chaperone HemW [Chromatium okenii]
MLPASGAQLLPPLALYIHLPWCIRKCPYCDFNSYASTAPPAEHYIQQLLADLENELQNPAAQRPLSSIFIGGGTPSLFSGAAIQTLLNGIRSRTALLPNLEITLEANPGAADARRFAAYRAAGVNRLSIGIQSLSAAQLTQLGRIHNPDQARAAIAAARDAGFDNLNIDMMFALPAQRLREAAIDLEAALEFLPEHISYYQLTLEPDTVFHTKPPILPDDEVAAEMAIQGRELLAQAGFAQYEVSAYSRPHYQCRHNLNYWQFGDYLGIGAGAHGKLTDARLDNESWRIWRTVKHAHPSIYLQAAANDFIANRTELSADDCVCEFALNALRLTDGFNTELFTQTTGLPFAHLETHVAQAIADGLLSVDGDHIQPTALGRDFLDDLVGRFA